MKKSDAIEAFGSSRLLAASMGITLQAVHQWGETVPEPRASQIREAIRRKIVKLKALLA